MGELAQDVIFAIGEFRDRLFYRIDLRVWVICRANEPHNMSRDTSLLGEHWIFGPLLKWEVPG